MYSFITLCYLINRVKGIPFQKLYIKVMFSSSFFINVILLLENQNLRITNHIFCIISQGTVIDVQRQEFRGRVRPNHLISEKRTLLINIQTLGILYNSSLLSLRFLIIKGVPLLLKLFLGSCLIYLYQCLVNCDWSI